MSLNLKKLAASVEKIAFDLASDLVQDAVYSQTTDPDYDAESGGEGEDADNVTANVSAMVLQFSEKEIDGKDVKIGDERVLIRAVDLGAIVPDEDDEMLGSDTFNRQVIAVTLDATKTLYTFQMRRVV